MAKSRKRKGHAARVAKRNAEILNEKKRQQKYFQKMMQQYQDELQKQMDEQTEDVIDATEENTETVKIVEDAIEVEEGDTK